MSNKSFAETYHRLASQLKSCSPISDIYKVSEESPWLHFSNPKATYPAYGWKLHVSASCKGLSTYLPSIVDLVASMNLSFKIPCSFRDLVNLNSGLYGASQIGKVVTIYTNDTKTTLELVERLSTFLRDPEAPRIPSDFYYAEDHCFSIRFGEIGAIEPDYDLCGRAQFTFRDAQGQWQDLRDGTLPAGIELPVWRGRVPALCPGEEDVTQLDLGFKFKVTRSYGRSHKRVFLLESEDKQYFILKQAARFAGECEPGRNYQAMLMNEYQALEALRGHDLAPEPLRVFSTDQYSYLLTRDLVGDSCDRLPPTVVQRHIDKLISKIAKLHALGWIHRDIKLSNLLFLPKQEDFRLIDFELAAPLDSPLPCSGGTINYRHPEASCGQLARAEFDWHSLRSTLLHVALGQCPSQLYLDHRTRESLVDANGLLQLEAVLKPQQTRPDLFSTMSAASFARADPLISVDTGEIDDLLGRALHGMRGFAVAVDEEHVAWRNAHLERRVHHQGINIGAAGILLGLCDLASSPTGDEARKLAVRTAQYLRDAPIYPEAHGLMTGNAGVAQAMAVARTVIPDFDDRGAIDRRLAAARSRLDEPDLFFGMGGVILSHVQIAALDGDSTHLHATRPLVDLLLERVCDYEGVLAWRPTGALGGEIFPTLGASHGSVGIALGLHAFATATGDLELAEVAVMVIRSVFDHGRSHNGGFVRLDVHPKSVAKGNGSWCHGSSGLLWSLLYGDLWREEQLQDVLEWCASTFLRHPIVGNPTMCHGLSGQLETALMLTQVREFAAQATAYAERITFVLKSMFDARRGLWPAEDPNTFTPDLWVGHMGPVSALRSWRDRGHTSILSGKRFVGPRAANASLDSAASAVAG